MVTWEPWEIQDGKLPGNQDIHPDIDTLTNFYQDGLPFGTTYNIQLRQNTIYLGTAHHKKQVQADINFNIPTYPYANDLQALAPSSFAIFLLHGNERDFFQTTRGWWDYNLASIQATEKQQNGLDEEDSIMLMTKHAALDPDAWFRLGTFLRQEGKEDAAAEADRKGFDQGYDQVGMSNQVGLLVDYYYDHNRKEEAEMVAKRAAEVYSEQGLTIYGQLLEKLGRLTEAEQAGKDISDRYSDRSFLDALYANHKDVFGDQNKILTDKVFPHGLEKVTISSFTNAPTTGCVFTSDSDLLQMVGLQVGDVVVSLDGYRIGSKEQYGYVRALSTDPKMDLIIWRRDRYLEVHASVPNRNFNVDMGTYPVSPQ